MPSNPKFPSSVEIKRVIAAAARAGIEIGSIEIEADKITIRPRDPGNAPGLNEYDLWKMSQGQNTDRVKHVDKESNALPKKPKT
jgi:hypothetical protein